jgi:internalin A
MKRRIVAVVFVVLVGAGGLVYWLMRPGLTSRVESIGGSVIVEPVTSEGPTVSVVLTGRPVADTDLLFLRGRHNFQRLLLDSTRVSGECLRDLNGSSELRWLSLGNCPVTDKGLRNLPALPRLELLNLTRTRITDAGLRNLRGLAGLRHLFICRTTITDAGLEYLKDLHDLEELDARETSITEAGVRRLQKALPKLAKVLIGKDED